LAREKSAVFQDFTGRVLDFFVRFNYKYSLIDYKEVRMKKVSAALLPVLFSLLIVLSFTACQKLKIDNLKANDHFKKANTLYTEEKYKKAIAEYEEALKLNPGLTNAYFYLGTAYAMIYKPGDDTARNKEAGAKSNEFLLKALEINPDRKEIILALGDMNDKMKNFEQAEKFYLKVLETSPKDPNIYSVLAEFYISYDKGDKAVEMYEKRVDLNPEDPEGYLFLAKYYFDRKKWDDALKYHEIRIQKIELSATDEKAKKQQLADAYYRAGQLCWARSFQTPADLMSPKERNLVITKGMEYLTKSTDYDSTYPEPWAYMGLFQLEKNKVDPAKAEANQKERDRLVAKFSDLRKRKLATEEYLRQLEKGK
jgi:tetratricopeptide (TPR) repeat protein